MCAFRRFFSKNQKREKVGSSLSHGHFIKLFSLKFFCLIVHEPQTRCYNSNIIFVSAKSSLLLNMNSIAWHCGFKIKCEVNFPPGSMKFRPVCCIMTHCSCVYPIIPHTKPKHYTASRNLLVNRSSLRLWEETFTLMHAEGPNTRGGVRCDYSVNITVPYIDSTGSWVLPFKRETLHFKSASLLSVLNV